MCFHFLFDYDGVLVKKTDFAQSLEDRHGIAAHKIRSFFRQQLQSCLRGEADMIELFRESLSHYNWNGTAEELYHALYLEDVEPNVALYQYIQSKLVDPVQCHIATNQDHHRYTAITSEVTSGQLFQHVFGSSEFGVAKPDLSYFKKIFAALRIKDDNLKKEQVVFIDDLPENIESAKVYGFKTHLYTDQISFQEFTDSLLENEPFPVIHHGRFTLVKMHTNHAKGYSDILSDPGTYQFLSESGPVNEEAALNKIKSNIQSSDSGKSLYWSIVGPNDNYFGFIAVHGFSDDASAISYGIHPDFRRQGLASEVLRTVLAWEGLKCKTIQLATHLENEASFRMLSKMALSYQGEIETKFGKRHVFILNT